MDFITGLPVSLKNDRISYNVILIIVNRFTKTALFLLTVKTLTVTELAKILYRKMEYRFGLLKGIVSD